METEVSAPFCAIILGRFGDIIQMLPAFKAIFDREGQKPVVVVSTEYASVLEGVSYVQPWRMSLPWATGTRAARGIAEVQFPEVVVPQFWNEPSRNLVSEVRRQAMVLQCHGEKFCIDGEKWPDYGTAMWNIVGFTRADMMTFPLVFDCRNEDRERQLARWYAGGKLPILLVNWSGISSPFPWAPEYGKIVHQFSKVFQIVDLAEIKALRIYDLLGLYDRAVGLITTDTATLHLAPASKVPYIAFTRGDWRGSVPKGNCILNIKYEEGDSRIPAFDKAVASFLK